MSQLSRTFNSLPVWVKLILVSLTIVVFIFLLYVELVTKSYLGSHFLDNPRVHNLYLAEFFYHESVRYDRTEDDKPEPYVHYQLGRIAFLKGDFDTAYQELFTELAYYPDHHHTYYTLGLTYGYDDKETLAIEAFRKFIEYMPGSWAARNDLAWLLFRVGDFTSAMEVIAPAVQFAAPNPWILNTHGVIAMNLNDFETAKTSLTKAAALVEMMTPAEWGKAYPGNHPTIYDDGLEAMRSSINDNLRLIEERKNIEAGIPIE